MVVGWIRTISEGFVEEEIWVEKTAMVDTVGARMEEKVDLKERNKENEKFLVN